MRSALEAVKPAADEADGRNNSTIRVQKLRGSSKETEDITNNKNNNTTMKVFP